MIDTPEIRAYVASRREQLLKLFDIDPNSIKPFWTPEAKVQRASKDSIINFDDDLQEEAHPMSQRASIGCIVHYQRYGSPGGEHVAEPSPAVITKVLDEESQRCQLFVMNPNGLYFNDTPYAEEPTPGHWSWPPRA